jgi:hypothetical protein
LAALPPKRMKKTGSSLLPQANKAIVVATA